MQVELLPGVTVYRGFRARQCHVWSPFVNKLEARLRFDGVPYTVDTGLPYTGPRGKVPYVKLHGHIDDEFIGDSTLITHRLIADGYLVNWNAQLTAEDRAIDLAVRALLEDKFYFFMVGSFPPLFWAREEWRGGC